MLRNKRSFVDWPSNKMVDPDKTPDQEPMDWEASTLAPTLCSSCNNDCFEPNLLLPHLLSDSFQLKASNIFPIVFLCGHLFHEKCLSDHQKCPIDCCDRLSPLTVNVAPTENSEARRRGFPSMFLGEDDYVLQFLLAYYNKSGPFLPRVVSADIVTNSELLEKFNQTKKRFVAMGKGQSLLLFHGTPYDNVRSICWNNFNIKKVSNGRAHGDGVYFSDR